MRAILIVILTFAMPAFGETNIPTGSSNLSLKKVDGVNRRIETRRAIESLNIEIANISLQLKATRAQGSSYQAVPGSAQGSNLRALEGVYQSQLAQSISKRAALELELKSLQ